MNRLDYNRALKRTPDVTVSTSKLEGILSDNSSISSIVIISNGDYRDHIEEIVGITIDPTKNYYFYIPGENEVDPYTLSLFLNDTETNSICQYKVTITHTNGNYYAELVEENIMEHITK